jgi:hypothetical protein
MKAKAAFPLLNINAHNNLFLKNLAENIGKYHRIIYRNNPGSKKMVSVPLLPVTEQMCIS